MKIGLFFGSFNPIHVGHLVIANFMATQTDLDKVWLVVSPQNPLKEKNTLAREQDRLHLVRIATEDNSSLQASDIEFYLPKPSYTIDTLAFLKEKHPEKKFVLIMGGDNLATLHKWKNYEQLIAQHEIYVYRRPNFELPMEFVSHKTIKIFDAPLMDISATHIRNCRKAEKSIQYLVTEPVFDYIEGSNMYKK